MKNILSGGFFVAFVVAAGAMGLFYLKDAASATGAPVAKSLLQGEWPLRFERNFREALPVSALSKNMWGSAEYYAFKQGRKGVVVGAEEWLFTDEELYCPVSARQALADNLAFIESVRGKIIKNNANLVIVLLPSKVRVYPEYLPGPIPICWENVYSGVRMALLGRGAAVTDMLPRMKASAENRVFLKTDTHWSPHGAKLAAAVTAELVNASFEGLSLPQTRYSSRAGAVKEHVGDLTRYIPGVEIAADRLESYVSGVSVASAEAPVSLFDDTVPSVTLIGTSYSANPDWNFEGFLKEALGTDVLNVAEQGQGPFVVMEEYLKSDLWKENPPKLVVWEIPERYLLTSFKHQ